jgi:hypothetical protein
LIPAQEVDGPPHLIVRIQEQREGTLAIFRRRRHHRGTLFAVAHRRDDAVG